MLKDGDALRIFSKVTFAILLITLNLLLRKQAIQLRSTYKISRMKRLSCSCKEYGRIRMKLNCPLREENRLLFLIRILDGSRDKI